MSVTDAPWAATITELAKAIRTGDLTPVDILDACLERIDRYDPKLQAFTFIHPDARKLAEAAHKDLSNGLDRGPLHGIPIAVKDNYTTNDMPTSAGTAAKTDYPLNDASSVARLRDAGALLFGKTRMHEFAWGMETPPTLNPRALDHVPGGSSGGSGAAVAGGLAIAALGSDTGGSIRIPAAMCGCVGLKPTFGLIGRTGIVPHSWSLDHAGPLTSCVEDSALVTHAMAGPDPNDPASLNVHPGNWKDTMEAGLAGMKIGVCRNHFFDDVTPEVASAVEDAIALAAKAGAKIIEFDIPELAYGLGAIFAIELASSTNYHDRRLREGEVEAFAPDVRLLVEMGRMVSAPDYLQAERYRQHLGGQFASIFDQVDVILGPTMPLTAWPVGDRDVVINGRKESVLAVSWRLTYPYNLLGLPALSMPCGQDAKGLPISLQIAGNALDEANVLRCAANLETALGGAMDRVSFH